MKQGVFLRAMASDATEAVIDVVGVIGWQVAYQPMRDMLRAIPESVKRVVFDIYSPGGDVWEGNGIVSEIGELNKRAETVARIQVAASMATLIGAACKTRSIASNGRFLIHNAWTMTQGDATAHEKAAQTLRDCETEAAKFYAERTGGKAEDMAKLMQEERWLMPEEVKALGFVQEISDPFKADDYEAVKQEIVAAGKWPKALAEMPVIVPAEGAKDGSQTAVGATVPPAVVPVVADKPVNAVKAEPQTVCEGCAAGECKNNASGKCALKATKCDESGACMMADMGEEMKAHRLADYERGKIDGVAVGKAQSLADHKEVADKLVAELEITRNEARKHQSEKDKLTGQLIGCQKAADDRAADLRKELDQVALKLKQFVNGALTFSAAVETWPEAMAACGGDYAKAATTYPQILEQYRAAMRQKETK